jgi:ABC-type transport system substrate-binding protein
MKKRILLACVLLLVAAGLVLAGCAGNKPETPAGPTKGSILKIATSSDSLTLGNPPTLTRMYDLYYARTCIETLLELDENLGLVPGLAREWQVDIPSKTITLVLQEGVKFHDGSDFNAEVAKWNLDRYRESPRIELKLVESVDVVNPHTIRLNLSEFNQSILVNLTLYAGMMVSRDAVERNGVEWAEKNPVGTGPFKFVSWERDVKQVYARFDDYWQEGKPYLDGVEWVPIADPMVRLASLLAEEIDLALDIDPKDARALEAEGDFRVSTVASALYGLAPDSANPDSPLADVKVRRAIEHAIDKEAICQAIGYGYWQPLYQGAIPGGWAENPNVTGYRYDPGKAKQLLAEAGYPDPSKLQITIYCMNSPQYIVDMVTAVHGYLKAIGIDAKLDLMEHGRFNTYFAGKELWPEGLIMLPVGLTPEEVGLLNRLFLPGSILISSTARPPEFQEKLLAIGREPDAAARQKLVWEAQKIMIEDHAVVTWIHTMDAKFIINHKVQNDGFGKIAVSYWSPANAWIK